MKIEDILKIPYPEQQKEIKPGYTVIHIRSGEIFLLDEYKFLKKHQSDYPIIADDRSFTIDGKSFAENKYPDLIVIDVPKEPEPVVKMAPALVKWSDGRISIRDELFTSFIEAKHAQDSSTRIIWPAPPRNAEGFYEYKESDWK